MLVRTGPAIAVALLVACASRAAADAPAWRRNVEALGLPLTVVDADPREAFLVFVTGDGGYQRVDRELADGIAKHGITTVALSTFRYFTTKREPTRVADDLGRIVDALAPAQQPIYAGGYSFGAEVVPDVVARNWTPRERARLGGLLLLAPSASASFEIDPLDWVRDPPSDPRHLVEESVRTLAPSRVVCIAGVDDRTAVCNRLADVPGVAVVHVPGTHHFEDAMPRVVEAAVRELFARERETPPR
jgi:type IV secretory pathway VirJ component